MIQSEELLRRHDSDAVDKTLEASSIQEVADAEGYNNTQIRLECHRSTILAVSYITCMRSHHNLNLLLLFSK